MTTKRILNELTIDQAIEVQDYLSEHGYDWTGENDAIAGGAASGDYSRSYGVRVLVYNPEHEASRRIFTNGGGFAYQGSEITIGSQEEFEAFKAKPAIPLARWQTLVAERNGARALADERFDNAMAALAGEFASSDD